MKFILGAIMAAAIAGVAFVQPAEARCFPNGIGVTCVHHGPVFGYGYRHHWDGFYGGGYERPYWWGGY